MHKMKFIVKMINHLIGIYNKPLSLTLFSSLFLLFFCTPVLSQTLDDPVGDLPTGDPDYMDMKKVRFRLGTDNWGITKIFTEFWPNDTIPKGSETIFEVYMDIDKDSTTGVSLENIGYDYKLYVNLSEWDGASWIWGKVYWNYDNYENPQSQDNFYINAHDLISWRFIWEFSLVGLKWPRIDWIARTFYDGHLSDQIPDSGHGSLEIDTSTVADLNMVRGEYLEFIYPTSFKNIMSQYEVLNASELCAQIESQLCGTEFHEIQRLEFDPWFQGVAWSGNPIKMGSWMWRSDPPWFIVFHELGHNYTLASERFNRLYPALGYIPFGGDDQNFGTNFMEAWATMVGLYAMRELFTNSDQYQLGTECITSLEQEFNNNKNNFLNELRNYEEDPKYSVLNPNLLDGIFLALADSFGYDIFPKFLRLLKPSTQTWDILEEIDTDEDYTWAKTVSMTITCCAFSITAGADLRDMFVTRWDFPIDDDIYAEVRPEIETMMAIVEEESISKSDMQFELFPNYPNPFNAITNFAFSIPHQCRINLKIYNILGEEVTTLINNEVMETGNHRITWNASYLPSGVYFYRLEVEGQYSSIRKCVLIK